jgi:hypothetical protein
MVSSINIILPALVAFSHIASAHFTIDYPAARGFDEDLLTQFPCGGQNEVANRTLWPLSGGEIALDMRDASANVEVLIGFGNSVGSSFEIVLRQTFAESGSGTFCMTGFTIPAGLNVADGMNATIQVITGGGGMSRRDGASGALYNVGSSPYRFQCEGEPRINKNNAVCRHNTNEKRIYCRFMFKCYRYQDFCGISHRKPEYDDVIFWSLIWGGIYTC